jgi:hypothetical protein
LADTAKLIDQLSPQALRELIASMVVRLEIDLTTGAVEMDLALPHWAFVAKKGVETRMGLDGNFLQRSSAEAQRRQTGILTVFGCERLASNCYDCHRRVA